MVVGQASRLSKDFFPLMGANIKRLLPLDAGALSKALEWGEVKVGGIGLYQTQVVLHLVLLCAIIVAYGKNEKGKVPKQTERYLEASGRQVSPGRAKFLF